MSSPIKKSLFLDHCQVASPALPLGAVVVPHSARDLLIVHLLRPGVPSRC